MKYLISAAVAAVCVLVSYGMLDTGAFSKFKCLQDNSGEDTKSTQISRRKRNVLLGVILILSFFCSFQLLSHTRGIIDLLKMMVALLCVTGGACVDYRERRIPNLFPLVLAVSGAILLTIGYFTKQPGAVSYIISGAVAAAACAIFLIIASLLTKGGVGAGDIKLLSALALTTGVEAICGTMFFAMLFCAITAAVLLIMKKKTLQEALPFGPFIYIGYVLAVLLSFY